MLGLPAMDDSVTLGVGLAGAWAMRWPPGSVDEGQDVHAFVGAEGRTLRARFEGTSSSDGEVLVFLEDVGRIREQAQQLKLASLGRLTASIAHEIRNPLSAIGHAGELLREERRGEMQERLLRILNDNVTRLDRIVSDILELGRQSRAEPELAAGRRVLLQLSWSNSAAARSWRTGVVQTGGRWPDKPLLRPIPSAPGVMEPGQQCPAPFQQGAGRGTGAVAEGGPGEGRVELHVIDDGSGITRNGA